MPKSLKRLVSGHKKRFNENGFDLDLSYISEKIIAMGFPAERLEGVYRNHIDDVVRFLDTRHPNHYKIYHLCDERSFDVCRFSGPVAKYPFRDHNAPKFEQIISLCEDVCRFLSKDSVNVIAINCKAGKGRTGVMVCSCLLRLAQVDDAEMALLHYATARTDNNQGVTIHSQRRYVHYYDQLLKNKWIYYKVPLCLTTIRIDGLHIQPGLVLNFEVATYQCPSDQSDSLSSPSPMSDTDPTLTQHSTWTAAQLKKVAMISLGSVQESTIIADLDYQLMLTGDVRIRIQAKQHLMTKKQQADSDFEMLEFRIDFHELDKTRSGKLEKCLSSLTSISLYFKKPPDCQSSASSPVATTHWPKSKSPNVKFYDQQTKFKLSFKSPLRINQILRHVTSDFLSTTNLLLPDNKKVLLSEGDEDSDDVESICDSAVEQESATNVKLIRCRSTSQLTPIARCDVIECRRRHRSLS